jgi:hypothetical protein
LECTPLKNENESLRVSLDHPATASGYALWMKALGTADADFLQGLLGQLASADPQRHQIESDRKRFYTQ